jgi:hypothetical protein
MDREARRSWFGLPLLAGLFAIASALAGSASISDRSAATRGAALDSKAQPGSVAGDAAAKAIAARTAAEGAPRVTLAVGDAVRRKVRCAGCGVVESMRRIDRREIAGNARDGGESRGLAALADTSSYQTVVRFRDGSRRVFNEATARALQSGDRVMVIAGVDLPAE